MQTGKACDETVTGEARMRIEGGLAHFPGLAKDQAISFDDLAALERQEITSLADQTNFFGCVASNDTARPDARTYTVGLRSTAVAESYVLPSRSKIRQWLSWSQWFDASANNTLLRGSGAHRGAAC